MFLTLKSPDFDFTADIRTEHFEMSSNEKETRRPLARLSSPKINSWSRFFRFVKIMNQQIYMRYNINYIKRTIEDSLSIWVSSFGSRVLTTLQIWKKILTPSIEHSFHFQDSYYSEDQILTIFATRKTMLSQNHG